MYKLSVPVVIDEEGFQPELTLTYLKELNANRIFLALSHWHTPYFKGEREEYLRKYELKKLVEYYKSNGFEIGVWIAAPILCDAPAELTSNYAKIVDSTGTKLDGCLCPSDPKYKEHLGDITVDVARAGAELIMYDDDFHITGWKSGINCFCDLHMKKYREILGEDITREDFVRAIFSGGKNKYRDVWLDVNKETLLSVARNIREKVNKINPSVRIGICSIFAHGESDGVDSFEIADAFAGDTKPFIRCVGAPYWSVCSNSFTSPGCLSKAIDEERQQAYWCSNKGNRDRYELFTEDDPYPRPRLTCPSVYVECFDQILHATGQFDGVMKYVICYGDTSYDDSFVKKSVKNEKLNKIIADLFKNKQPIGLKLIRHLGAIKDAEFPDNFDVSSNIPILHFIPIAAQMASQNSLPTTFSGDGPGMCFGEDGRHLKAEDLNRGLIIDSDSAEILTKLGIDVGLEKSEVIKEEYLTKNLREYFVEEGKYLQYYMRKPELRKVKVKSGAKVLSEFVHGEDERFIASYSYENADGQRFFVLCFPAGLDVWCDFLRRSYYRQRQLIEMCEWVGRKPLPAVCPKNPDLYMLCSKGKDSMAVGMWNLFSDTLDDACITLDKEYAKIRFVNCDGSIEGRNVKLKGSIEAYGFAGFEVFD